VINTSLLREFITNPFGNEQKARELLAEIEGRPLSADELARGEFCFQVAFYFLALRAIDANIDDASVRKVFLHQLHERVRAFYAGAASPVGLGEQPAAPAGRDRVAVRLVTDEPGPADAAASAKLALFERVGMPRLEQYRQLAGNDRFGALAQLLLLHYGARPYHPVIIEVVADLLATSYIIASEIVGSSLEVINTRRSERDAAVPPLLLGAGMPDLVDRKPKRAWPAGRYGLFLFEDVAAIGGNAGLSFKYVLALCDGTPGKPLCLVTLENSRALANILCVFEGSGAHSNYGSLQGHRRREFMGKALILLRDRFDLGELQTFAAAPASDDFRRRVHMERDDLHAAAGLGLH